jgi:hypothetical protein
MKRLALLKGAAARHWQAFCLCRRGMVTIEGAFVATVVGFLMIGVIDFGLAYKRHAELENAVRAGTQYALVRRPQQGDIDPIRDAVWDTAPFYQGAPGTALDVEFYCECPDGAASQCSAPGGVSLCSGGVERYAFVRVRLSQDFDLLFAYPGVGTSVDLAAEGSVRLN